MGAGLNTGWSAGITTEVTLSSNVFLLIGYWFLYKLNMLLSNMAHSDRPISQPMRNAVDAEMVMKIISKKSRTDQAFAREPQAGQWPAPQ
jgi:hypothetical protein